MRVLPGAVAIVSLMLIAAPAAAQRTLHWDAIEVAATLDARGHLQVDETQAMVFTGYWNGGERRFDVRPHQRLALIGVFRDDAGTWRPLREDDLLDDVDEYAWVEDTTLRWRTRLTTDGPFADTHVRYLIRYELANILIKKNDTYTLDHNFLFPERAGVVQRFDLRLTTDPAWQPQVPVREVYSARDVAPGTGYVVTIPMTFAGSGVPAVFDGRPPFAIRLAVIALLSATALTVLWVFGREWTRGRFAPLETSVDEAWLQTHVFRHPAEIVGAAWDDMVGSPEVVALIARLVSEGKLASEVGKDGVLTLHLKANRASLKGHERTLVDRLFFNDRVKTNTQLVKQHYREKGFNPAHEISPELHAAVAAAMADGQRPRPFRYATWVLLSIGTVLLLFEWTGGDVHSALLFGSLAATLVLSLIALVIGGLFRSKIHWRQVAALLCLLAGVVPALLAAWWLWQYVGAGAVKASTLAVWGVTMLALSVVAACANAMVSRQGPQGIAFRKRLAAARVYFAQQLRQERPALRDEWFPWLLALELQKQMDDWSALRASSTSRSSESDWTSSSFSSSSSGISSTSSGAAWTGFAGGRSGGAGGGAAWVAAAGGIAAGVSAPSAAGSSDSGSSSSSSSGGSSGGGGGGGW
jgi:hypothetical protein